MSCNTFSFTDRKSKFPKAELTYCLVINNLGANHASLAYGSLQLKVR